MKHIPYELIDHASTDTHLSVDDHIDASLQDRDGELALAMREGFAASSGVLMQEAETDVEIEYPQIHDEPISEMVVVPLEIDDTGLADV